MTRNAYCIERLWRAQWRSSRLCTTDRSTTPGRTDPLVSSYTARLDLPAVAASVPLARHVTLDLMRAWGSPHDQDDAALLVSELVANVVEHVPGEAVLTLELDVAEGWLRIAVIDGSSVPPVVRLRREDQPGGRGLQLVEAIADRWGAEDHHGGKRIWFELRAPTR